MPRGQYKSRTFRRVKVKTPGGETKTQYKLRKPASAKCAKCGAELKGTPRERPQKIAKLSKSQKRPTRPYGGNLCTKCTRKTIKAKSLE